MNRRALGAGTFEAVGVVLLVVVFAVGGFWLAVREAREWKAYAAENGCEVIRFERSRYVSGGHTDPKTGEWVSTGHTIPSRTTYRCRNGMEIVR